MKNNLTLELTISLNDDELFELTTALLQGYYTDVHTDCQNYIFASGSPFCLVAHIDTKRPVDLPITLVKYNKYLANNNGILGADDRAGIYMIFNLLRECIYYNIPFPTVLITNYEESKERGLRQFINDKIIIPYLNTIHLFIGLDRCGYNDCVLYKKIPRLYYDYIKSFGFNFIKYNRRSDMSVLARTYDVPVINLAIGYYLEHTEAEVLNLTEYENTFIKVFKMLKIPLRINQ